MKLYIIWQQTSHYLRFPLQAELSGGSASESKDAEIRVLKSLWHSIMPCGTFFAMTKSLGCPLWNWKLHPPNAIHAGLAFCISIPAACPFNPVATMECLHSLQGASLHHAHQASHVWLKWRRAAGMQFIWYQWAQYFEECPPTYKRSFQAFAQEKLRKCLSRGCTCCTPSSINGIGSMKVLEALRATSSKASVTTLSWFHLCLAWSGLYCTPEMIWTQDPCFCTLLNRTFSSMKNSFWKQALRVANCLARFSLEWTCRTCRFFRSEHSVSLRHLTILVFKPHPWIECLASPSSKAVAEQLCRDKCLAVDECDLACQRRSTSFHEACVLLELPFGR